MGNVYYNGEDVDSFSKKHQKKGKVITVRKNKIKDDLSDIQLVKKTGCEHSDMERKALKTQLVQLVKKSGYKYSDIAGEALKTQAEREKDYGPADRNHENIAKIWNVLLFKKLSVELTKEDVALLFCGAKLAREANSHKKDNLVDAVAYLGILDGFNGGKDER